MFKDNFALKGHSAPVVFLFFSDDPKSFNTTLLISQYLFLFFVKDICTFFNPLLYLFYLNFSVAFLFLVHILLDYIPFYFNSFLFFHFLFFSLNLYLFFPFYGILILDTLQYVSIKQAEWKILSKRK